MHPRMRAWFRARAGKGRRLSRARIDELVEQILEELTPRQRAYVQDPARRFAALTGGRAGKTTASKARLVIKGLRIRRARLLFLAVTKDQAADLMWGPLKDLLHRLGIEFHANETLRQLVIVGTGSLIRILGADDKAEIEKLRGRPWHEVIIDEGASHPPKLLDNLINKVIGPRLGDFDGALGMIGTPGHVLNGLFYDATRRGSEIGLDWDRRDEVPEAEWPEWSVHRWSLEYAAQFTEVQATAWRVALETKRKKGWSDANPIWRREYLGEWAADVGEMMYAYFPHVDAALVEMHPTLNLQIGVPWNLWKPAKKDGWAVLPEPVAKDARHALGIDFGHGTAFALQVLAYSPSDKGRNIYQRFELVRRGMYARKIAEAILGEKLDHKKPGGIVGQIGWPDIMVADLSNLGGAILDELANVYGITIQPADQRSKPANVELMNGDLVDGRMHVLEGSELAAEMAGLQWRVDEFGILREPKHGDNACDGAIYPRRAIAAFFDAEEREKPPGVPRRQDRILEDEDRDFTPKAEPALMSSDYYDEAAPDW